MQDAAKLQRLHTVLSELITGAALRKSSQLAGAMLRWWRWAELQRERAVAIERLQRSAIGEMLNRIGAFFHGWVQCTAKAAVGNRHSRIVSSVMRRFLQGVAIVRAFGKWQAMTLLTIRGVLTQQTEQLNQKIEEIRGEQAASEVCHRCDSVISNSGYRRLRNRL